MNTLFAILLSVVSVFLILLVLVQRGRGGGLTGALGGMGGQSAFGTKAGDAFTRVTIVAAGSWILLSILAVKMLGNTGGPLGNPNEVIPTATIPGPANDPLSGGGGDGALEAPRSGDASSGAAADPRTTGGLLDGIPDAGGAAAESTAPAGGASSESQGDGPN